MGHKIMVVGASATIEYGIWILLLLIAALWFHPRKCSRFIKRLYLSFFGVLFALTSTILISSAMVLYDANTRTSESEYQDQ